MKVKQTLKQPGRLAHGKGGKSEINRGAETLVWIPFRALLTYALLMLVFVANLILARV